MTGNPTLPGVYYRREQIRAAASPLRSDVAGFIGRTRWGVPGRAIRVEGWRDFIEQFGPLDAVAPLSYSLFGYFENGGEVAYVVRIVGEQSDIATGCWSAASAKADDRFDPNSLPLPSYQNLKESDFEFCIEAKSPGAWANNLRVGIRYTFDRNPREPSLHFRVQVRGEPAERFTIPIRNLSDPDCNAVNQALELDVESRSRFIRLKTNQAKSFRLLARNLGPRHVDWDDVVLKASRETDAGAEHYLAALSELGDQPEVAIVALPGLHFEPELKRNDRHSIICAAMTQAAELQDRLVVVDVSPIDDLTRSAPQADDVIRFADDLRQTIVDPTVLRAAAIYHPWIRTQDALGGIAAPLRTMPSSGHVAGVISRIDRERGAHHTPSNIVVNDTVDVETLFDRTDNGLLSASGINLIRSIPGRGPTVWGGRTLDFSREGRFLGQRRFIHRLVRVMRRVTEPLVFDTNGPQLWLTLLHTLGTVLLEAFRSGALQGDRPEDAFRIRCDERTNPLDEREQGRVVCEVDLALAAPMEFITLRVTLSQSGQVEVFDE